MNSKVLDFINAAEHLALSVHINQATVSAAQAEIVKATERKADAMRNLTEAKRSYSEMFSQEHMLDLDLGIPASKLKSIVSERVEALIRSGVIDVAAPLNANNADDPSSVIDMRGSSSGLSASPTGAVDKPRRGRRPKVRDERVEGGDVNVVAETVAAEVDNPVATDTVEEHAPVVDESGANAEDDTRTEDVSDNIDADTVAHGSAPEDQEDAEEETAEFSDEDLADQFGHEEDDVVISESDDQDDVSDGHDDVWIGIDDDEVSEDVYEVASSETSASPEEEKEEESSSMPARAIAIPDFLA